MSINCIVLDSNDTAPPPDLEPANDSSKDLGDNVLRNAGWLCGFRVDSMHEPRTSGRQVASYVDGAAPIIEKAHNVATDITTTDTKRNANYVHCGWSLDAATTISPWTSSRIAATNQPNAVGTWYTRIIKTKRFRVEVLLEDLAPMPEFEAAVEEALRKSTIFEKFQGIYRVLGRWGDVIPLEIEIGSSIALTGGNWGYVHPPEISERKHDSIAWLSTINNVATTITVCEPKRSLNSSANYGICPLLQNTQGADLSLTYDQWVASEAHNTQCQRIVVNKVAPTISLLSGDLQTRLSELYAQRLSYVPPNGVGPIDCEHKTYDDNMHVSRKISSIKIRSSNYIELLSISYSDGVISSSHGGGGHVGTEYEFALVPDGPRVFGGRELVPRVPKEEDVYSEYFGDKGQNGCIFNDRVIIGNSNALYISSIQVWWSDLVYSIQFTYSDHVDGRELNLSTARHGGPGNQYNQFALEDGEYIVTISGRQAVNCITQLCFVTNRGRTSEVFGGGEGQSFSSLAPRDRDGNYFRLQYVCGKSNGTSLTGIMFIWTPCWSGLD
ncbi:unnamed protein product [Rhizoctonia solani]|uniref:Jacalin-type lectin domain-containing protein n=1 Tax=Rhizoctonia solani TaxID=456999 RepID=A0A8H3HCY3_9AGAM|nr:unnamed protein product [Rhizoctonia solani]